MNHLKKAEFFFFFYPCHDDDFQSFASVSYRGKKKRKKVEESAEKKIQPENSCLVGREHW